MKAKIEGILSGLPGVRVKSVGNLWQVSVGGLAGARENGESLAHDLRAQYLYRKQREEGMARAEAAARPVPVETPEPEPVQPDPRIDLQAARIAELEAQLEALKAQRNDMFDAGDLADLIREDEPHADAQRRWRLQYTQLNNRLVDTRLPSLTDAERELLNRLQRALYAGRRGAIETI
jgi:hypothetical protein